MKQAIASLLLVACAVAVRADAVPLAVEGAWARSTVAGQDSTGAFMTLSAREPLTLLGVETPAAGIVEIHEMKMVGDVMKMRAMETLALEAGKPVKLAPGGLHLMLMDLKVPFKAGTSVAMTLRFRDARGKVATLPLTVPVKAGPMAKH